jgi:lysophospholipase
LLTKPLGTSSSLFNEKCNHQYIGWINRINLQVIRILLRLLVGQGGKFYDFALYLNPFYNYSPSPLISAQPTLTLVDGGETNQNNPIWPLLHRGVDVIIVNDNSADTDNNFANGSEIYNTYVQSLSAGLTRMPVIPSADIFIKNNLNQHPTFFGCHNATTVTIVYLPNYLSNQDTFTFSETRKNIREFIDNGVQIASNGNDAKWPLCLACGLMIKAGGKLPYGCPTCITKYCYN